MGWGGVRGSSCCRCCPCVDCIKPLARGGRGSRGGWRSSARCASQLGPCAQAFSFLAIATSYIGFILGLTGFLADGLQLPSSRSPLAYGLTLLPPFALALTYPDGFLKALDVAGGLGDARGASCRGCWRAARRGAARPSAGAQSLPRAPSSHCNKTRPCRHAGTYGVMTIFGVLPAAMAWQVRSSSSSSEGGFKAEELVPGGAASLAAVVVVSLGIIGNQLAHTLADLAQQ